MPVVNRKSGLAHAIPILHIQVLPAQEVGTHLVPALEPQGPPSLKLLPAIR